MTMPAHIIIRYDWIGAYNAGVKDHPQTDLRRLGVESYRYEAVGIADCAFIEVDRLPDPCPEYIEPAPDNFKFTEETK